MRIPVVFLFTGEHKALQIREQRGGAACIFPALSLGWLLYILALPKLGAFSSNIFFSEKCTVSWGLLREQL